MKLQMHKNSLFAILLRSPWWVSFLIAGALFAALRLVVPSLYGFFFALPFLVIGAYAAWQQLRAPSASAIARTLGALREMDWTEFSGALEDAFKADGYAVSRIDGGEADFELQKAGRVTLVGCKRWKAASAGVEPLRRLKAAAEKREAQGCTYVAAGEVSANALAFAAQSDIRLLHGAELARLFPRRMK